MYVRRHGTKGPLQRPYSSPYAVLTPGDKTFLIDIGGRAERISVDPFQPVILAKPPPRGRPPAKQSHPSRHPSDSSTASKHQQAMSHPAVQTSSRTGRTIRPPMRYQWLLRCQSLRGGGGGGVLCGVRTIESWKMIKTNPWRMYSSEVVKRAHRRGVEETKSLLPQFRLISRRSRMMLII